jgi:hypothetical protein
MKVPRWFLASAALIGCGGVTSPSTIDGQAQKLWCGQQLCRWMVEDGTVQPVRTWHELDPEVRLTGPTVRLSRIDAVPTDARLCAWFEIWVRGPAENSLVFEVDLANDGTVEYSEMLRRGHNVAATSYSVVLDYLPAVRHSFAPRPISGSPTAQPSARLSLVKTGVEATEINPIFVRLRACPPDSPDAGP